MGEAPRAKGKQVPSVGLKGGQRVRSKAGEGEKHRVGLRDEGGAQAVQHLQAILQ